MAVRSFQSHYDDTMIGIAVAAADPLGSRFLAPLVSLFAIQEHRGEKNYIISGLIQRIYWVAPWYDSFEVWHAQMADIRAWQKQLRSGSAGA
jgi:hypothetical protein